ncbi:MAG: hypothetical protein ABSD74_07615 [Rhizomicrobium sp.]|jgi:hypothetical protein
MLLTLSNTLKTVAVAGLLGIGLAGAGTTSASADTYRTQCTGDDCYRVRCNDFGYDCVNIGYEVPVARPYHSRWICDADGDDCHWARIYGDDPGDYDRNDEGTYPF